MKNILLAFLLLFPCCVQAQTITLFAGNGHNSFGGDGSSATSAGIPDPVGGVWDKHGNYYFVGLLNEKRIRKINPAGIISTVVGNGVLGASSGDGGPATAAVLNGPSNVKVDTSGNLYIVEHSNNDVRKVDITTGVISTIAGSSGGTGGTGIDGIPATASLLYDPQEMCFDKFGNIYITDAFNYKVRRINTAGIISTFAGNGTMGSSGDGGMATDAQFMAPAGIVADDTGNIYIADAAAAASRIRKVSVSGIITTYAGNGIYTYVGDGLAATSAQISPVHLAIDSGNNIYIADRTNYRVYKVDTSGILHHIAGNGSVGYSGMGSPATAVPLDYPSGISLDDCGNLYITLADSNRIVKVALNPTCNPDSVTEKADRLASASIEIFPDPADDILHIEGVEWQTTYALLTTMGKVVLRGVVDAGRSGITVRQLPTGMYLLVLTDELANRTITKIMKQ